MLLNIILGCCVFIITNFSLLYASHLVVRRFFSKFPPSVRLVAIGTLFYAFIILIFQALSPFHAISRTWVTATCLLLTAVAHFLWGNQRNLKSDIEPIKTWLRDGLSSRWSALIIICGFVVLLSFSRALLMPPLAWDCLTYHLTFATLWIKEGTLLLFKAPDQIQGCAHFPINGELFAAWLLLPFRSDILVNIMNFPITLLGGISCYAIARELRLSKKVASFASGLICFNPVIYNQLTTEFLDNAIFAFSVVSVLFAFRYLKEGNIRDGLLSSVPAGILLGIKYTAIPVVGLIFIAILLKTISLKKYSTFSKKMGLVFLCLLILCVLGGRKYIINSIDAGNPVYPFPLKILHYELFQGSSILEQEMEWMYEYEKEHGWDKYSLWEMEYRKFLYIKHTAGPKVFLLLLLASIALFARPKIVPKRCWYFLSSMWIIPLIVNYSESSANIARMGLWADLSTRYLSSYIALITIQGITVIERIGKHFNKIYFFLGILIVWDLMYINKNHLQEVEVFYSFVILLIILFLILFNYFYKRLMLPTERERGLFTSSSISRLRGSTTKLAVCFIFSFIVFSGGLYFLQSYRDSTRYLYYQEHLDLTPFPRNLVSGWEFLDRPGEQKTIAMTMGYKPPGHQWFFYPLFGKEFQNDIAYVSSKYKWEVPVWLHQGLMRGDDISIWRFNLERKKVNYIFLVKPWPIELQWMLAYQDEFQLVFSGQGCMVFKFMGENV